MHNQNIGQKGFTLVELSIVIVIIGLIVAGVTAGQSLVKQAQLRSVIGEQEQVKASVNAFLLEYNGVPGDLINASAYWPAAMTDGCQKLGTGNSIDVECNGDGNKKILIAAGTTGEMYIAWKHLQLASLYPGSFVPTALIPGIIGGNIPASKFSGVGITFGYDDATSDMTAGDGATTNGRDLGRNIILFGAVQAAGTGLANGTAFSVPQAYALDVKADDGSPVSGVMYGSGTLTDGVATCITSVPSVAYNLDATDTSPCAIAFTL